MHKDETRWRIYKWDIGASRVDKELIILLETSPGAGLTQANVYSSSITR